MSAPVWRIVGFAAAGTAAFALPAALLASPGPTISGLRADQQSAEQQKRSAILSLYSLDARLTAANDHLSALQRRETALRAQRATLETELRLATVDARLSQRELARRVRSLYDHGSTSTLEVIFTASSLSDAMTELDNLNRVTSIDHEILIQVRSARTRELVTRRKLAMRERRLQEAIREAGAETRTLAGVRAERSAYISQLSAREALDGSRITQLEAQAQAAEAKAELLTRSAPAATTGTVVSTRSTQSGASTITMASTGYCLSGSTATGIPAGWGVAAVDPSVIPLGTHLSIPGYGEAVAADTGGAIVGDRIDLWFPTCARAGGWGTRSVTIALH